MEAYNKSGGRPTADSCIRRKETVMIAVGAADRKPGASLLAAPKQWPNEDTFQLEATLGPPDLIVKSKAWTMAAQAPDIQFRAQVDLPLIEGRWVRAAETKPSLKGRRIAHHASTYLIRPGDPAAIEAERRMRGGLPGADVTVDRANAQIDGRELFT